jgi:hypothetical protein
MELPDPPAPVVSHGLSTEQCELITNIILTRGAADDELGTALLFLYEIYDGPTADELVRVLDSKKKRELLKTVLKRQNPDHPAIAIVTKIARASEDWANDRNILAHGFGAVGDGGTIIVSSQPKPPLHVKELGSVLKRANWLYLACSEIRRIVVGTPSDDPLPDRPA